MMKWLLLAATIMLVSSQTVTQECQVFPQPVVHTVPEDSQQAGILFSDVQTVIGGDSCGFVESPVFTADGNMQFSSVNSQRWYATNGSDWTDSVVFEWDMASTVEEVARNLGTMGIARNEGWREAMYANYWAHSVSVMDTAATPPTVLRSIIETSQGDSFCRPIAVVAGRSNFFTAHNCAPIAVNEVPPARPAIYKWDMDTFESTKLVGDHVGLVGPGDQIGGMALTPDRKGLMFSIRGADSTWVGLIKYDLETDAATWALGGPDANFRHEFDHVFGMAFDKREGWNNYMWLTIGDANNEYVLLLDSEAFTPAGDIYGMGLLQIPQAVSGVRATNIVSDDSGRMYVTLVENNIRGSIMSFRYSFDQSHTYPLYSGTLPDDTTDAPDDSEEPVDTAEPSDNPCSDCVSPAEYATLQGTVDEQARLIRELTDDITQLSSDLLALTGQVTDLDDGITGIANCVAGDFPTPMPTVMPYGYVQVSSNTKCSRSSPPRTFAVTQNSEWDCARLCVADANCQFFSVDKTAENHCLGCTEAPADAGPENQGWVSYQITDPAQVQLYYDYMESQKTSRRRLIEDLQRENAELRRMLEKRL